MSSNQSRERQSSETLNGILEDAGMKNFKNTNHQVMRMRAAGVLIGHFRDAVTELGEPLASVEAAADEADIAVAVENALASATRLDSSYIFVSADGSDITLAGWVASDEEILESWTIAAGVTGVSVIHNELSRAL